jgi:histidinol-phosphate/aromatic aminotransferase/cobyric acid decarboxylase-like protein
MQRLSERRVADGSVVGAEPRQHGGSSDAELAEHGLLADDVLDFSSSTNPYGPAPAMLSALQEAAIGRYPDSSGRRAREALGASIEVPSERLVLGNGAADLLWSLARTLLGPGRRGLLVEPTFCELGAAARATGAEVVEWRSHVERAFAIDLAAVGSRARDSGATVVYLCSPNTPTGGALPAAAIADFARAEPRLRIILDQSFLSLSELHHEASLPLPENVTIVRSLTKDHGIPGVRVGYLIATPELCRAVEHGRPAWTTSAFAQAAVVASCDSRAFVAESRERLLEDRRELERDLAELGIETFPSRTTFLLARLPGVPELRARLLARHHILIRDCASFGLPGFMRLGAKPRAARQRLIDALRVETRP